MTKERYVVTGHGNFLGIAKDGKPITGYFDNYERDDLYKIVNELNEQEQKIKDTNNYALACDDTLTTIQEFAHTILTYDFNITTKKEFINLLNKIDYKDLMYYKEVFEALSLCNLNKIEQLQKELTSVE